MKISAQQAIKRTFPETTEERRPRQQKAASEQRSQVGEALASRLESRRKQTQKIVKNSKPSVGWNVPPEEGVEYTTPNPSGRNELPQAHDAPRKGAGRAKVAGAYGRGG
jgi:hypothetical protein